MVSLKGSSKNPNFVMSNMFLTDQVSNFTSNSSHFFGDSKKGKKNQAENKAAKKSSYEKGSLLIQVILFVVMNR